MTNNLQDLISISKLDTQNIINSSKQFSDEMNLTNKLIGLYTRLIDKIDVLPEEKIVEYQLFWITLRGLFISSELIYSAHIAESFTIVSRSLEATGYANHIRKDPSKAKIWITEKHNSKTFNDAFRPKWGKGNEMDEIKAAYNLTRKSGVHSNLDSTIFHQLKTEKNKQQNIYTDIGNIKDLHRCILYVIHCYSIMLEKALLSFHDLIPDQLKKEYEGFKTILLKKKETLQSYFLDHSDLE